MSLGRAVVGPLDCILTLLIHLAFSCYTRPLYRVEDQFLEMFGQTGNETLNIRLWADRISDQFKWALLSQQRDPSGIRVWASELWVN